jgi:ADP-dependent NAD(P)H-hydrate dehydratase / NAD(P)H-hydrate epimerase
MKLVSSEEMRAIDAAAIGTYGIPGIVLMENAGLEVVKAVEDARAAWAGCPRPPRTVVFAGRGNNGGDGLVVARHLHNRRADVRVLLLAEGSALTGDAATNYAIAKHLGVPTVEAPSARTLALAAESADILIDAILGTGATGAPRGLPLAAIRAARRCCGKVIAVDIPSGVSADDGAVAGEAVHAHVTVTFGLPKIGLYTHPGRGYCGEVRVADIGLPRGLLEDPRLATGLITAAEAAGRLPARPPDAHKGQFGRVVVLGGSPGYTGAACLAAEGALRAGAGLVTVGCAESLNPILEAKLTEAMTRPLPETPDACLGRESVSAALELCATADAVVLGPGLSRHPEASAFARAVVGSLATPLVIDADALFALGPDLAPLRRRRAPAVLTPHPGEMSHLLGVPVEAVQSDRLGQARALARDAKAVVVLKGAGTVIGGPEGDAWVNPTGSSALATGGTGDVLAGAIAGLLAGGADAVSAAVAGVYYHGAAGDLAASRSSGRGVIAGDVARALADALP